jgi:hypothetical protein
VISGGQPIDAIADLLHDACGLVPQHRGEREPFAAHLYVSIAATHPAGPYPHQHFPEPRRFDLDGSDAQPRTRRVQYGSSGLHHWENLSDSLAAR